MWSVERGGPWLDRKWSLWHEQARTKLCAAKESFDEKKLIMLSFRDVLLLYDEEKLSGYRLDEGRPIWDALRSAVLRPPTGSSIKSNKDNKGSASVS